VFVCVRDHFTGDLYLVESDRNDALDAFYHQLCDDVGPNVDGQLVPAVCRCTHRESCVSG
jgi:hypothetical protein